MTLIHALECILKKKKIRIRTQNINLVTNNIFQVSVFENAVFFIWDKSAFSYIHSCHRLNKF